MRLYNMRMWCRTSVGRSRGKDDVNSPDVRGSPTTLESRIVRCTSTNTDGPGTQFPLSLAPRGGSHPFRVFPIHPRGRTKVDRRHIKPGFISTYCSDITIDLVRPYHRCSTNCPYQRSCPLSPALSPTSNDLVSFFPGNMRYAE